MPCPPARQVWSLLHSWAKSCVRFVFGWCTELAHDGVWASALVVWCGTASQAPTPLQQMSTHHVSLCKHCAANHQQGPFKCGVLHSKTRGKLEEGKCVLRTEAICLQATAQTNSSSALCQYVDTMAPHEANLILAVMVWKRTCLQRPLLTLCY